MGKRNYGEFVGKKTMYDRYTTEMIYTASLTEQRQKRHLMMTRLSFNCLAEKKK